MALGSEQRLHPSGWLLRQWLELRVCDCAQFDGHHGGCQPRTRLGVDRCLSMAHRRLNRAPVPIGSESKRRRRYQRTRQRCGVGRARRRRKSRGALEDFSDHISSCPLAADSDERGSLYIQLRMPWRCSLDYVQAEPVRVCIKGRLCPKEIAGEFSARSESKKKKRIADTVVSAIRFRD